MFYELPSPVRENALAFLAESPVKGSNASKIVDLVKALENESFAPYYEVDDDTAKLVVATLQEVTIKGKLAAALLEVIIKFSKPVKQAIPKAQAQAQVQTQPQPQPSMPQPTQPATQQPKKNKK